MFVLVVGAALIIGTVWFVSTTTAVDVPRSAGASTYFEQRLLRLDPDYRAPGRTYAVRGTTLEIGTAIPTAGDQRRLVAPLCLIGLDYIDDPRNGVRTVAILSVDQRRFEFDRTCVLAGY